MKFVWCRTTRRPSPVHVKIPASVFSKIQCYDKMVDGKKDCTVEQGMKKRIAAASLSKRRFFVNKYRVEQADFHWACAGWTNSLMQH
jgi:hypothetical protein